MQLVIFLFAFLAAWSPNTAEANACTDGVDCYCDRVGPGGDIEDGSLLFCEDFEAETLHDDTSPGGGAPLYGPWYDDTGQPGLRGNNSYWSKTYGAPASFCGWRDSSPSPTKGTACAYSNCYAGEWSSGDPWTANAFACIDIFQDGEFNDEVSALGSGPIKLPDGSGVWDGSQTLGHRIQAGVQNDIIGTKNFTATTEIGITMALAYAANAASSGVWNYPWKHNEFINLRGEQAAHWNLGRTGLGGGGARPYSSVFFNATFSSASQPACESARQSANIFGQSDCNSITFRWGADPSAYNQAIDFPWGTWACHRAYVSGMGTSNMTMQIWHNETLVFSMTGFDGTVLRPQGYKAWIWNAYANANQGLGETPTSETTYRYEDNVHVRAGQPVSCSQIGFGAAPIAPVPKTTEGVNFGQGVSVN